MKRSTIIWPLLPVVLIMASCGACTQHDYRQVTPPGSLDYYFVCNKCGHVWDPRGVLSSESEQSQGSSIVPSSTGITEASSDFKPNYSILFIGNSFTFRNDLPKTFSDFVTSQGFSVTVDSVTQSSYYLYKFNDPSDAQGAIVHEKLEKNKYDYVFLQDQSRAPIDSKKNFFNGVRGLVEKIRAKGATPILYETWGFDERHSSTASYGGFDPMARKIAASYEAIGEELGVTVSKAGMAFHTVKTNHSDIDLFHDDYFHPSVYGTYLAMMTHYATIYHKTVIGAPYVENLYQTKEMPAPTDEQLSILQNAAYEAAFSGKTIVTDEYKIKSEDIR